MTQSQAFESYRSSSWLVCGGVGKEAGTSTVLGPWGMAWDSRSSSLLNGVGSCFGPKPLDTEDNQVQNNSTSEMFNPTLQITDITAPLSLNDFYHYCLLYDIFGPLGNYPLTSDISSLDKCGTICNRIFKKILSKRKCTSGFGETYTKSSLSDRRCNFPEAPLPIYKIFYRINEWN